MATDRKGSSENAIASRVIQNIIRNSSEQFRNYLQRSGAVTGGASAVMLAPPPDTPIFSSGGWPEPSGPVDRELSPSRIVRRATDYPRWMYHPWGIPGRLEIPGMPMPEVTVPDVPGIRLPNEPGPDVVWEDGSIGPEAPVVPLPSIFPTRPPGEQHIDAYRLLAYFGLV